MTKNKRFNQQIIQIPADIWSKITQIDQLQGQWIERISLGRSTRYRKIG